MAKVRKLLLFTAIFANLAAGTPAAADWQNTNWNMTRPQVIALTKAVPIDDRPEQEIFGSLIGAEGTYEALGHSFKSEFYFNAAGKLRVVRLLLDDPNNCSNLKETVRGIYSTPVEENRSTTVWMDASKNNIVRFSSALPPYLTTCLLIYSPLVTTGDDGL